MSVACEFWFGLVWLLDQLPKLRPIKRQMDLKLLDEKFKEKPLSNLPKKSLSNVLEQSFSDLPGVDVFVTTADPEKEPPLTTANAILSILAADYPPERLSCYLSDDGASFYTYKVMCEVATFSKLWVPFCRKHDIEPRNPDTYFSDKKDPFKDMTHLEFVQDYYTVKMKYDEFKVYVNGLPQNKLLSKDNEEENWKGTWRNNPKEGYKVGNHAGIVEVLKPKKREYEDDINFEHVNTDLPMLVYLSREKRPSFDHNKKAGAMNALMRASAILSNGAFVLNLDCDHYIHNPRAIKEAICFMLDRGGKSVCYVQFPQRFDGIDPSDRYANKNTVFFDVIMRCHDGIQGPFYVGTGCVFRRVALYGIDPPNPKRHGPSFLNILTCRERENCEHDKYIELCTNDEEEIERLHSIFGKSTHLIESFHYAEKEGLPLKDHHSVQHGREPGDVAKTGRKLLGTHLIEHATKVISCYFEANTQWGRQIGWIYGSLMEDVVTGYTMHNRGWKSLYCVPKCDAFRGTAPINLTDRLHQVLRWATGSVEIFFSENNAFFASEKMKILQRIAYINLATYPFTSIFLTIYCYIPAISLFTNNYIVQDLTPTFLSLLLTITTTLSLLAILEIKWSGISLEQYWRNQQFWLISGTSSHLIAVLQGLLKAVCKLEIKFNVTAKSSHDEDDDEFADLYAVKWSSLMIPHVLIMVSNILAIAVAFTRAAYSTTPIWGSLIGGVFFSGWVLAHLHPFILGLKGKGDMPGIVFIWSGLIAITISLLWVVESPIKSVPNFQAGLLQIPSGNGNVVKV
ncbi:hypothetical protein RND81_04G076100 [Saponaria officinalis]|uniref:Uncharacterized protein n=1 Tax=Saponaria officinalis TaxID=3572 RepID=A0AAW1LJ13_SAPOF